jgi:cofilin
MEAFNQLKLGRTGVKYIVFKIGGNDREIVVDELSKEKDFDVFQKKMTASEGGTIDPKYAVYDCEYELPGGDGKRYSWTFFL